MRIAYTHPHCWPDVRRGGERYLHELAAAATRHGHDVTILSQSSTVPGVRREEGVEVVRLRRVRGGPGLVERGFGPRVLPRLLRGRYDVVHSLMPSDAVAAIAAQRLGRVARTVYTNLGIPDHKYAHRHDRRWHQLVMRHGEVYTCLSAAAADALERTFDRRPAITPAGVRLDAFPLAAARDGPRVLLFSGSFDAPMKNLPVLIEAFNVLAERHPDLRLELTGPGDPAPHLRQATAHARERIHVLPLGTPDLAHHYGRASVTVLPSFGESFALALVESLACGTPVVAARSGAGPERVEPGTGALCELGDVDSLVDACDSALGLAADPATAGRCRSVAARHDWDVLFPRYEAIYRGEEP